VIPFLCTAINTNEPLPGTPSNFKNFSRAEIVKWGILGHAIPKYVGQSSTGFYLLATLGQGMVS